LFDTYHHYHGQMHRLFRIGKYDDNTTSIQVWAINKEYNIQLEKLVLQLLITE